MSVRTDIKEVMTNVRVDEDMKQSIITAAIGTQKKQQKSLSGKRVILVALIAVMCLGTIVVAAGGITKLWNKTAATRFNANEEIQKKMLDDGYAKLIDMDSEKEKISATDGGITITAKQIFVDKRVVHIYFEVDFDDKEFTEAVEGEFEINAINYGDKMYSWLISWDYFIDNYDEKTNKAGYFLDLILNDIEVDAKELEIKLANFKSGEKIYTGEWCFRLDIHKKGTGKTVILNDKWKHIGKNEFVYYNLTSIELYPVTICINYDLETNIGFAENIPIKIVMKDGKVYEDLTFDKMGDSNSLNDITRGKSTDYNREIRILSQPLDIDEIDYIEICGKRYEV